MKNKTTTIIVIILTLILAGVAVFTAIRLYQLRQESVSPAAPESKPKAAETAAAANITSCSLSFSLALTTSTATSTATATGTSTATATGTSTATATGTSTATATGTSTATSTATGQPNACNGTCGSNNNCQGNYVCYQGFCRNPSCVSESDCSCATSTATSAATQATLPDSGTSWPSIFGMTLGVLVIIGSLLLAI